MKRVLYIVETKHVINSIRNIKFYIKIKHISNDISNENGFLFNTFRDLRYSIVINIINYY